MANTKITPELLELIQFEARKAAEAVYAQKGTEYGVASVPAHTHNGVDTTTIPPSSVDGFVTLPAISGGVLSPGLLGNQVVTQGDTERGYGVFATISQARFMSYPLVVIQGGGAGVDSQFNGGDAPDGTLVFFENGTIPALSGLWVRSNGAWCGIAQATTDYANKVA